MISSRISKISRLPVPLARITETLTKRQLWRSNSVHFFGTKPLFDNKELREKGIFDANDVLIFETLHEMRVNATQAFHNNPLFGTFKEDKFNWMSFGEWGKTVDVCRNVLKDLGM